MTKKPAESFFTFGLVIAISLIATVLALPIGHTFGKGAV